MIYVFPYPVCIKKSPWPTGQPGLLFFSVPAVRHAKRQPLGFDVRPRQILATSFHVPWRISSCETTIHLAFAGASWKHFLTRWVGIFF